jgi:hypothetical protein
MKTRMQVCYKGSWRTIAEAKSTIENEIGAIIDKAGSLTPKQKLKLFDVLKDNAVSLICLVDDLIELERMEDE